MGDLVIKTDIDRLMGLVEQKKEISIEEAAKELGISPKTIESLGDVLEEEGIVHVKYKFTTPYLVYERPREKTDLTSKEEEEIFVEEELDVKSEFFSKAKARGATEDRAKELWKNYVSKYKDYIKKDFFSKAKERGYPQKDIEKMWKKVEASI